MVVGLLAVLAGIGLMIGSLVSYRRAQEQALDEILDLTPLFLEPEVDVDGELLGLAGRAADAAGQVVERVDQQGSLGCALEKARIPLRPGEYVIVTAASGLGVAALLLAVFGSVLFALLGPAVSGLVATQLVRRRIAKRRKAFEAQLPDALSLIASSLSAGHTFLRAIQMMCEESGPPMSEEFSRIVAETRLGDPLIDSLERTAERLDVRDFDMVVQAVRIQQTVGGRLATLLHTLSDFIRARGELRREVMVLTAEGRMSAYVLAGLVPMLFLAMQVLNPGYVKPLFSGSGLVLLVASGLSVVAGMLVILRMVKIDI
ncbi:MAG: pilus assembly protein CpaF [Actinomycetota bacterium]|jgi:tight adherence protein B|nr:pilus assembly protein CpaF [Actinomycetota bacterium]MEA2842907.1 pilus assembly protein CpaF [Actinomycetota bacterium]